MADPKYVWIGWRVWIGFIVYVLASMIGPRLPAMALWGQTREGGWIILVMLVFTGVCMIRHRGDWRLWQRILFVPAVCMAQTLVLTTAVFNLLGFWQRDFWQRDLSPLRAYVPVGLLIYIADQWYLVTRLILLTVSIPFILWAMRKSDIFVRVIREEEDEEVA